MGEDSFPSRKEKPRLAKVSGVGSTAFITGARQFLQSAFLLSLLSLQAHPACTQWNVRAALGAACAREASCSLTVTIQATTPSPQLCMNKAQREGITLPQKIKHKTVSRSSRMACSRMNISKQNNVSLPSVIYEQSVLSPPPTKSSLLWTRRQPASRCLSIRGRVPPACQ